MRLIDRVVNAPAIAELTDSTGRVHYAPGVGAKAEAIRSCGLRYILDKTASQECMTLVSGANNGLFDPQSPLLRMPSDQFWMEWFGDAVAQPKVGLLVESDATGRCGSLTGYFQDEQGRADKVGLHVEFDLAQAATDRDSTALVLRHERYQHLNGLLSCATLRVEPLWEAFFIARDGHLGAQLLADLGTNCWYFLPVACAFAAMINSDGVLREAPSQLERLNRARRRRGVPALLDHIEVSMQLGQRSGPSGSGISGRRKRAPRLHHVRGHFVRRAGKTFWRSPHLRGDAEAPAIRRTVKVKGAPRLASAIMGRRWG